MSRPTTPCVAEDCAIPGRHATACEDHEACRGCLPRLAAAGIRLCDMHERIGREHLAALAGMHHELSLSSTLCASGTGEGPMPVGDAARQARSAIRAAMVTWTRIVHEEREVSLPADDITEIGVFLGRHWLWLCAHEDADQVWHDFDFAWHWAITLMHPNRLPSIECSCGDRVTMDITNDPDQVFTCPGCGSWGVLAWWRDREGLTSGPLTLTELPAWLWLHHGQEVTYEALRGWRDRGWLTESVEGPKPSARRTGRPAERFDPEAVALIALHRVGPGRARVTA